MKFLSKVENEDELVINNMPLVVSIAYKYKPIFPDDHDDLIQIGSIGLLKAIRTFRPELGNQLSTLATISVNREILKSLSKKRLKTLKIFDFSDDDIDVEDNSTPYVSDIDSFLNDFTSVEFNQDEKKILYMKYYLNMSFAEIGNEYGFTRQWAHLKVKEMLDRIKDNATKEESSIS